MDATDLAFAGAAEQARMLAGGAITAPALLERYLERIARVDPELRSYRVVMADKARREAAANAAMLQELAHWYAQGKIKPVIDHTLPMSALKQAYEEMGSRSVMVKLVMVNT